MTKPWDNRALLKTVRTALELNEPEPAGLPAVDPARFSKIVGRSAALQQVLELVARIAPTTAPVLVMGESGTGKELFAHAIHNGSARKSGPFVVVNCGALPRDLVQSELFGYEAGAFTGAAKNGKPGKFELAEGGTLFLDEVEGMSPALQCKLLRVLQEHEIMPVGGNQIIRVDVRIVAATNEDLEQRVEEGSFRRDLYYRLNTLPAIRPPDAGPWGIRMETMQLYFGCSDGK